MSGITLTANANEYLVEIPLEILKVALNASTDRITTNCIKMFSDLKVWNVCGSFETINEMSEI